MKQKYINWDGGQIVRYILVGICTTVVGLTAYYMLVFTILSPQNSIQLQLANIISWILGSTFAYVANRKMVFKSKSKNIKREITDFYLARIGTLLLEVIEMFILVTLMKMNDKIIKIVVMFITVVVNYFFSKVWVFRKENGAV